MDNLARTIVILISSTFTEIPFILIVFLVFIKLEIWLTFGMIGLIVFTNSMAIKKNIRLKNELSRDIEKGIIHKTEIKIIRYTRTLNFYFLFTANEQYQVPESLIKGTNNLLEDCQVIEFFPESKNVISFNNKMLIATLPNHSLGK